MIKVLYADFDEEDGDETSGVTAIGLVEFPANETKAVALSKTPPLEMKFGFQPDKQYLTGVLLIPDQAIYRKDESNGGEPYWVAFSAAVIERLRNKFMRLGLINKFNFEHISSLPVEATMIETWISQDPAADKSAKFGFNLPAGTWFATVHIPNKDFWDEVVKTGRVSGFSVEALLSFIQPQTQPAKESPSPTAPSPPKTETGIAEVKATIADSLKAMASDLERYTAVVKLLKKRDPVLMSLIQVAIRGRWDDIFKAITDTKNNAGFKYYVRWEDEIIAAITKWGGKAPGVMQSQSNNANSIEDKFTNYLNETFDSMFNFFTPKGAAKRMGLEPIKLSNGDDAYFDPETGEVFKVKDDGARNILPGLYKRNADGGLVELSAVATQVAQPTVVALSAPAPAPAAPPKVPPSKRTYPQVVYLLAKDGKSYHKFNVDYALADGTILSVDETTGEAWLLTGEMAPDGTYTATDGTIIVVASGKVSTITPPTAPPPPPALGSETVAQLAALLSAHIKPLTERLAALEAIDASVTGKAPGRGAPDVATPDAKLPPVNETLDVKMARMFVATTEKNQKATAEKWRLPN
jgi:hypothetical protein